MSAKNNKPNYCLYLVYRIKYSVSSVLVVSSSFFMLVGFWLRRRLFLCWLDVDVIMG